jgi:hypothetical protein
MGDAGPTNARGENVERIFVAARRGMLFSYVSACMEPPARSLRTGCGNPDVVRERRIASDRVDQPEHEVRRSFDPFQDKAIARVTLRV